MPNDEADPIANASAAPDSSTVPSSSSAARGSSTSASSWTGKRVGPFRIVGFLGRGAMGRVFRAEDTRLKRQVALKVFPTILDRGKRRVRLERFVREARSAAALDHPGIVRVYEADEFKGWYYIATELVEGGTVGRLLEANGPFDMARGCAIGAEVGEALEHAHDHGIIHRDVKPDNILLARGGRAKLADFGLAYRSDPNDSFHVVDEPVGTAFYIAPEIARGHGATALSDQYSLAASMWAILTGAPPYPGTTRDELIKHHLSTPVPSLRNLRPDLPQGLCKAIERALSKNPEDRYPMCEQFAKVLRVYTIGQAASASTSGTMPVVAPEPTPAIAKPSGSKAALYAGAIGGGVVVLALIAFLATRGGNDKPDVAVAQPTPAPAPVAADPKPKPPAMTPAVAAASRYVFVNFDDNTRGVYDSAVASSGSTQGVLKTSTNTLVRDPDRPGFVQKLAIVDDPAVQKTPDGKEGWFVRHISGRHGSRAENTPRPTKGWVGFWAKTSSPGLRVAIALDNEKDDTADRGVPQDLIADGQWHCYQWNLNDAASWQKWLMGDGVIDGETFTVDSIQLWGPNADAEVLLDDVAHDAGGKLAE